MFKKRILEIKPNLKSEKEVYVKPQVRNMKYEFDFILKSFGHPRFYKEFIETQLDVLNHNIDYFCCLYGAKRTGKYEFGESILENLLAIYKEKFIKGNIEQSTMTIKTVAYDKVSF